MNKKLILLLILVLSLTFVFTGCASVSKDVVNGDFAAFDKGNFTGWTQQVDKDNAGDFARMKASTSDQDKGHGDYLKVNSTKYGVNYLYQTIKLKKGATYKITADIKTSSNITSEGSKNSGAYVGFKEDEKFTLSITSSTQNVWKTMTGYFTPATDKPLTLVVGIGHDKIAKAKGTAFFDNIKIEKIDAKAVPENETVATIRPQGEKYTLADDGSTAFVVVGAILTVLIIAAFIYTYRKTMSRDMLSSKKMLSPIALFIYMMLIGFIFRFGMAIWLKSGMFSELKMYTSILEQFSSYNVLEIVGATHTTLPAGMLYLLAILNGIAKLLHIAGDGLYLLVRLPFILADLVAIYLIYNMLSKRTKEHSAIFVAGLYAVLPSIVMVSTGWGMSVSIVGCLLIAMCYAMLNKKYITVSVLLTVSLLFSNLTVLILPLVLAFLIMSMIRNKDARLKIGLSALISFVVFYCITVPFVVPELKSGKPFFYFTMMFNDLVRVNVLSYNAFNLYAMIGMNMGAIPKAINILNYIFVITMMIATVLLYIKNRDRLNIILMAAFTLIAVSTLSPRASVETMALGIVLLFAYAAIAGSRRIYALLGGFSTLLFLNTSLIMSNSGFISNQINATNLINFFKTDASLITFSVFAVLLTLYMAYVVFDVCFRERDYELAPLNGKLKDDIVTRYQLFKERRASSKQERIAASSESVETKEE